VSPEYTATIWVVSSGKLEMEKVAVPEAVVVEDPATPASWVVFKVVVPLIRETVPVGATPTLPLESLAVKVMAVPAYCVALEVRTS
jgi:hypothetical protein